MTKLIEAKETERNRNTLRLNPFNKLSSVDYIYSSKYYKHHL